MDSHFLWIVIILSVLAIVDLIVGVSNDAVNFLNSAIGSKVASRNTIMMVASAGILLGAGFSSGMMEVARKGVFYPQMFGLEEIMVVFVAVMITDILLLDLFNTLALPTSTTVSLVFELLGAALALGLLLGPAQGHLLSEYINVQSALRIVSGIFTSVGIAFTLGTAVQFLARLLFTFDVDRFLPRFGALFSGLALCSIFYFVLIEGLHGSQLLSEEFTAWLDRNTLMILFGIFVIFSVVAEVLRRGFGLNPLKFVVLGGTFALAMAFAGNDLVNFIGVPITGIQTYGKWIESGLSAEAFDIGFLSQKMKAPTGLLFGAGTIMILTLWFSGKARKVTETEVSLGRQDSGDEKFRPNGVSRTLVGSTLAVGRWINGMLPERFQRNLDKRFEKVSSEETPENDVAFDLIRASINLITAAFLIAYGTSLKLPLSTTYVTFMVAMGSSLADRAWGRESAVFRVAGVLNVILGWFVTAFLALITAALMATLMYKLGFWAIVTLFALALFTLVKSHLSFAKKERQLQAELEVLKIHDLELSDVVARSKEQCLESLDSVRKAFSVSIEELSDGNAGKVLQAKAELDKLRELSRKRQMRALTQVRRMSKADVEGSRVYLLLQDLLQDIAQSSYFLTQECATHLLNHHAPPSKPLVKDLRKVEDELCGLLKRISDALRSNRYGHFAEFREEKRKVLELINKELDDILSESSNKDLNKRSAQLASSMLLEAKDIAAVSVRLYRVYADFDKRPKS
ncbi:inorganic phosphate transporter [bacterium]|nr:inorganic phosphate transporter [bacterium]